MKTPRRIHLQYELIIEIPERIEGFENADDYAEQMGAHLLTASGLSERFTLMGMDYDY